ncbi:hypothetical protein MLD38_036363 [Melastoma candidum]|uniref:Uncharacterized protein n=1 Tax=Melastoma candidum TaxID=119954 RepID=A0ACB9LJH5_9MYRT|nr:hypothetical protein MLD38_036363 [Melastoma candidum]
MASLNRRLKPRETPPAAFLRRFSDAALHHFLDRDPVISQATELLRLPESDWDIPLLTSLLFRPEIGAGGDNGVSLTPTRASRIVRSLSFPGKAVAFFDFLRGADSPKPVLSRAAHSLIELAIQQKAERTGHVGDAPLSVLDIYGMVKDKDVPLSAHSVTLIMRYLRRKEMIKEFIGVFEDVDPKDRDSQLCNFYLEVMLRLGRSEDALKVLDEMLVEGSECYPDDYTCDVVLGALLWRVRYCKIHGGMDDIVGLVMRFGELGFFPNSVNLGKLMSELCNQGKVSKAWDLLQKVIELGGQVEVGLCNMVLSGLGRRRDSGRMNKLMEMMMERKISPNVATFGILINHLCKCRKISEALEIFKRMRGGIGCDNSNRADDDFALKPDVVIYNTLIDGLCKVGRPDEGFEFVKEMKSDHACAPNTITYNCLIDGYCKAGDLDRAREIFERMEEEGICPNNITVSIMVDGMCRNGRINQAMVFIEDMKQKGIFPDVKAYTTLIKSFCGVNNIGKAMELFDEICGTGGLLPDAIAYYALISGLCQAGRMHDANNVVTKLKEAGFSLDGVSYNDLISGFCRKNRAERAYELLEDMENAGIKADCVTFNTLISHCGQKGDLKAANKLMEEMSNRGIVPTVVTYGALIHAYCLKDKVDEAMKLFRDMTSTSNIPPNNVIYNILINMLCKNDKVEEASSLMDDMIMRGVKPNTTTFNALFKGLRQKNLLERAFELMDQMTQKACRPDYVTMEILTEWLSAVGEVGKLKSFLQGHEVTVAATSHKDSLILA